MVAAITLASGLCLRARCGALRLGRIAQFLSRAVVTGFLAGAAIDVIIGELPKITGTSGGGENAWQEARDWLRSLGTSTPPR